MDHYIDNLHDSATLTINIINNTDNLNNIFLDLFCGTLTNKTLT